jgi:dienelactone hydrolase
MAKARRTRSGITVVLLALIVAMVPAVAVANDTAIAEHDVAIPAGDHDIPGTFTYPTAAVRPVPAVLMLHGFGSFKDEVGDMYARVADDLAERGIASLRIDFAGSGDSTQPWVDNTYDGMVDDSRVALDWLISLPEVDGHRVGLLGFSLGTKVAMTVAGTDPRVAAFASWSGSTANGQEDFQFYFDEYYDDALANGSVVVDLGFTVVELSIEWFETIAASRNLDLISGYRNPLLAIAGSDDMTVDPHWSKALIRASSSHDAKLRFIRGADHIYHVLTPDQSFAEHVMRLTARWFDSRL